MLETIVAQHFDVATAVKAVNDGFTLSDHPEVYIGMLFIGACFICLPILGDLLHFMSFDSHVKGGDGNDKQNTPQDSDDAKNIEKAQNSTQYKPRSGKADQISVETKDDKGREIHATHGIQVPSREVRYQGSDYGVIRRRQYGDYQ